LIFPESARRRNRRALHLFLNVSIKWIRIPNRQGETRTNPKSAPNSRNHGEYGILQKEYQIDGKQFVVVRRFTGQTNLIDLLTELSAECAGREAGLSVPEQEKE
jgi:hypothetical protein